MTTANAPTSPPDPAHRFVCVCGWSGRVRDMSIGWFNELLDGSCPNCDTMLSVCSFPTRDQIREPAPDNRGAAEQLAQIKSTYTLGRRRT